MSAQKEADKLASDKSYDTQKQLTTNTYNKQIDETADSYQDLYDENAVQRIINERSIAENMANLGLTDSGLNRTQQTAVQLSYGNAKNKIDVSRQKAVDSLTAELASKISQLDTEKQSAAASIDSSYAQAARSSAQDMYNTAFKAEQEQIAETNKAYYSALEKSYTATAEAEKEANYIIKANGATLDRSLVKGSLKDNGISVVYDEENGTATYVDTNSKYSTTFPKTTNPYTGQDNSTIIDLYGAFSNGYQPKGDKNHGKIITDVGTDVINNNTQNIWLAEDGRLLIWDGDANEYKLYGSDKAYDYDYNGDGTVDIRDKVAMKKKK